MASEKSNREICTEFRELLTTGFYADASINPDEALRITKPWRGEIWKAFREIEDRLCTLEVLTRSKLNGKISD